MKNAWAQITLTCEDLVLTPRACEELAPTSRTCEELVPTIKHLVLSSATGVRLYFYFQKVYPIYTRVRNHLQNLCTFLGFNNFNAAIFVLFPLNKTRHGIIVFKSATREYWSVSPQSCKLTKHLRPPKKNISLTNNEGILDFNR